MAEQKNKLGDAITNFADNLSALRDFVRSRGFLA